MVATKRVPLAEVDNGKERRAAVATTIEGVGGGSVFQEPLGGFIFVCNNDTMGEDFERHLFGLPQRYQDSVKAIQPGLPLFLYNYTTRCLHGVFEASSDGGLNIEPDAWGENKESRKNGRQSISRFPSQVRVRWREERPPLDEEKFRPVLYHYDGPKFRLQLSKSEAQELLKLFGASPVRKVEEVQEDTGGEWEKVKTKSKGGRNFRATLSKGPTSPIATGGRKRGTAQNSSSSNGGASLSGYNNFLHEAVTRGRERDNKIDSAQRWRNDSDSWSGSSSADTTSSKNGLHEEDRSKKLPHENGFADISEGGSGFDRINGVASSKGVIIHTNGSNVEADQKVEVRLFDDDSNELNGFSVSPIGGANCNIRPGFVSYSAALRAGMLASAAAENGFGGSLPSAPADEADSMLVNTSQLNNSTTAHRSRTNSNSGASSAANVSPSSLNKTTKGDLSVDTVDGPSQKAGGLNKVRSHAEGVAGNHAKVGPLFGKENGKLETKADSITNGDASGKKPERTQAWGKPWTAKSVLPEFGSLQSAAVEDKQKASVKTSGESTPPKKLVKDVLKNVVSAGENGDISVGNSRQGQPEARDATVKPTDLVVRKNAWQGNDGAVLRLLHDPDPAVSSSSVSEGTTVQGVEQEVPKKQEKDQTPPPQSREVVVESAVEKADSDGRQSPFPKQSPSSSSALMPNGSHSKALTVDGPVFQPARIVHESRRQQFEKNQEERPHYRKQQGHPQEHLQHPPSMIHAPHQLGHGLMPLHIPTPSPSGMQQHHHHPFLSPTPQPLYRDRSRSRGSNGSSNGNVENVHNLAYRPISRNILDGDIAMQSPMVQGSWGLQSPVLMMQPMPVTLSRFLAPSPQMLSNAEALHAEILEIARAATPSPETRVHAEAAVECVRSSVKQLWPEADVEVFGSFATGLCLHHSDVDVVVVDAPPPEEVLANPAYSGARLLTPLIRALAAALKDNEWCEGLNTIETASMPVIKLRCNPIAEGVPGSPPVAIDITIGGKRSESFAGVPQVVQKDGAASRPVNPRFEAARNAHNGAPAREFVIERLRQLPALAPLVLLLKSYLRTRSLNDVYSGGLGSFALTLMLVFYLERAPISCGTPQGIPRSSKSSSPSPSSGETRSQPNGEIPQANGEFCSTDVPHANGETIPPVSGETLSPENRGTPLANGLSPSPENGKTSSPENGVSPSPANGKAPSPANGVSSSPVNGDTPPANEETSALSVDTSQASTAAGESADFSDDDSCASSQLTSTSASSIASVDMTSLYGSSSAAEIVNAPTSSSNDEPLLRKAGNIVEELLGSMNSVTSPNLGTLLIGFLHFFGQEIDFSRVRLVLKGKNGNPGGLFVHEKNARTLPLWIDDPLRPDANIGAGSFNIWQVQAAMRDMLSVIAWPQSVGSNPLFDGERVGKGPGRRRHPSLLQPFLEMNTSP